MSAPPTYNESQQQMPPAGAYQPSYGTVNPPPAGAYQYPPAGAAYPPAPQAGYPPAPGYDKPAGQYPPNSGYSYPPPAGAVPSYQTSNNLVITQPTQSVVVVGGCPACRVGYLEDDFTCLGVLCAILFFPIGILCCLAMRQRRCGNCGAVFG
ncbi:membrane protein BRI3-like [Physella acuta]|uniref:membrane protein BRI3-like n=1 Tax=Physella acuta TaxID=109671 RepID=UPI0027DD6215|nr:membrane protein BRI3-like [Physella acuta]